MKSKLLLSIAALVFMVQPGVQAAPIHYEGSITVNGPAVTGLVGPFSWFDEDAANVDFWTFFGIAGRVYSIRGTRLNLNLDPALALYSGTTMADASQFDPFGSFGGL